MRWDRENGGRPSEAAQWPDAAALTLCEFEEFWMLFLWIMGNHGDCKQKCVWPDVECGEWGPKAGHSCKRTNPAVFR